MDSLVVLFLASVFVLSILKKSGGEIPILFLAFCLRVAILCIDYYQIADIPFSGGDSENFHRFALVKLRGEDVHYTRYTDFLAFIYLITGTSRLFAQALNVVLSYLSVLVVRNCCIQIGMERRRRMIAMSLMAFMPSLIAFSGILLREAWIQFFIIVSVYYFIRWYKTGNPVMIFLCLLSSLLSAYMHEGMIAVVLGYSFAFLLYNHRINKEKVSPHSFIALVFLFVLVLVVLTNFSSIGGKLGRMQEGDFLESEIQANEGGSAYLQWMAGSSYYVALLLSPIRMFYFLFSPLPFDWRSFLDVIVFFIDSIVYFVLLCNIFKRYKQRSLLRKYLLLSFLFVTLVFSIGTNNTGTALRHRAKIFPLLVVGFSVASSETSIYRKKQNSYKLL